MILNHDRLMMVMCGSPFCQAATGNVALEGFIGGFFDGRYAYFIPSWHLTPSSSTSGKLALDSRYSRFEMLRPADEPWAPHPSRAGKLARIDTHGPFDASSVSVVDIDASDSELVGFYGGVTDGAYAYLSPMHESKVARINVMHHEVTPTWKSSP